MQTQWNTKRVPSEKCKLDVESLGKQGWKSNVRHEK